VLVHPLLSFPFSRDFLTVWKRTVTISMKEPRGEEEQETEGGEEDEDEWADIPSTERLFDHEKTVTTAAYQHLTA
jgi:hypothetical protein